MKTVRLLLWLPLIAFLIVLGLVSSGLIKPHDTTIQSQMVGRPLPAFTLPSGRPGEPSLASAGFADGKPRLVNIFASWCVPCLAEAPALMVLKREGVRIEGIAIRDRTEDLAAFLQRNGDPYERIGRDDTGAVQIALGSSGVPESFVVDGKGIIRAQHIGEIRPEDMAGLIAAMQGAR